MALAAGTRIGQYEVLSLVGAGGMGEVYRAHDTVLGRDVALKVLPTTLAGDAGKPVDKRTDIWAFGCVVYELLVGRRAFEGETVTDVLSAIVRAEPDWTRLPAGTPPSVQALLDRLLRKDAQLRLRDIGDVPALLDIANQAKSTERPGARRSWRQPLPASIAAIALLALGMAAGRLSSPSPVIVEPPLSRLAIDVADDTPVANRGGLDLAISRDGRRIAFLADTPGGRKIFVRDLADETIRALSGTEGADDPFFSWDGRSIGFESRSGSSLMPVSLDGGAPVPIAGSDGQTRGAWWGADEAIVYGARNRLWRIPATGGTPQALVEEDAIYGAPHVLPDGGALLFNRDVEPAEILALDLRTRAQSTIVTGKDPTYVSSGHLVFARDDKLMAVRFDATARQARGEPVTLVQNLRSAARAAADIAVSTNGTAAYMLGLSIGEELPLVWLDRDGRTSPGPTRRAAAAPTLSPDGRWLAFVSNRSVWVVDLIRGGETRLATDVVGAALAWTPDSREVAYVRRPSNAYVVESRRIQSDLPARTLMESPRLVVVGAWARVGRRLAIAHEATGGNRDISLIDAETGGRTPLVESPAMDEAPRLSPDGSLLAYVSEESGQPQVFVRPFPAGPRLSVSIAGGSAPVWAADSRSLYFAESEAGGLSRLLVAQVSHASDGPRATPPSPVVPGTYRLSTTGGSPQYDVATSGRLIVPHMNERDRREANRIHVLLNLTTELKARLP